VEPPDGGWRPHTWLFVRLPIGPADYNRPKQTPWHEMDRLELYYSNAHEGQPRGEYIRVRQIFLRSMRSYHGAASIVDKPCRDLSALPRPRADPAAGGSAAAALSTLTELAAAAHEKAHEFSSTVSRAPLPIAPAALSAADADAATDLAGDAARPAAPIPLDIMVCAAHLEPTRPSSVPTGGGAPDLWTRPPQLIPTPAPPLGTGWRRRSTRTQCIPGGRAPGRANDAAGARLPASARQAPPGRPSAHVCAPAASSRCACSSRALRPAPSRCA
jgi:hypothetical protein